ncbi:DUF1292 domain-containing protein [Calidifontibacillus oryziterrae]|uniref:DUF1292 domain-containing protein n=1 Tax=Calidifontibacillus oryziterrae TaxID=1191699 RepID=UPI0002F44F97|nr:DUF1292 domain-containing protein [Calidifontibacillus oryziterrae]
MEKFEIGEVFTISDENDDEQEVEVLAIAEIENTEYVAVSFVADIEEDSDEDLDIFFLKVEEDGDLSFIENDDEFEKVSAIFDEIFDKEEE